MSGIQIHTSDPINPAKATDITTQTSQPQEATKSPQASRTTTSSNAYPAARPGQGVPAPTKTVTTTSSNNPAPPQAGSLPSPAAPAVTAKPSIPPPPKAGERPLPPEAYAPHPPTQAKTPSLPQPYPPQMSQTLQEPSSFGVPPSSVTSTTNQAPSHNPVSLQTSTHQPETNNSLQHPPGYVQNQHATDMTQEQRAAVQQEEAAGRSRAEPILGYTGPQGNSSGTAAGIWEGAKTFAGQVGQKAGELHGDIWDKINKGS